jgi:hypothetical protein
MRNKELALRRIESLDGKMKKLRNALNSRNIEEAFQALQEMLELKEDLQAIIEREN